jgi:hypothetical protein
MALLIDHGLRVGELADLHAWLPYDAPISCSAGSGDPGSVEPEWVRPKFAVIARTWYSGSTEFCGLLPAS